MGEILGKGDNKRSVRFHNFLFNSVQILIYYCFFSAGLTVGPDWPDAHALKLSLLCERRREAGEGWEGKGYLGKVGE